MDYNYLDLFHGIGGFALGAHWAGMKFKNHFCSDIEKYPVELYKLRFPDSIQLGDITKIDFKKLKEDYPGEWIITGGFPCQDISVAGKGKGLIDEKGNKTRSGLWFDYWKGIRILRPRFVIIENVRALLIRGMETVLTSLAEIGYNAEWQIISAENMGAPHKRERVWIVAHPRLSNLSRWVKIKNSCPGQKERNSTRNEFASCGLQMADSKSTKCKFSGNTRSRGNGPADKSTEISNASKPGLQRKKPKRGDKRESRLSTKCNWWSIEPSICGMVNGLSNELDGYQGRLTNKSYKRVDKLKGLGNSIVPQIAELLFNQIKEYI